MTATRPVTAGCRATLVYNLAREGKGGDLQPPSYDAETARATALPQQWARSKASGQDDVPEKVVYPLEHAYSIAELDFAKLKGADAAAAALLGPRRRRPIATCTLRSSRSGRAARRSTTSRIGAAGAATTMTTMRSRPARCTTAGRP